MHTKILKLAATAVAVASIATVSVAAPTRPLNAGQTGIRSNAGIGNGCEGVPVGAPEIIVSTKDMISTYDVTTVGEPVWDHDDAPARTEAAPVYINSTQVGGSDNFKRNYSTSYVVEVTHHYLTTTTVEHHTVTDSFSQTTTIQHMAELDPGNSAATNRAKECTVPDVVTVGPWVQTGHADIVTSTDYSTAPSSDTETVEEGAAVTSLLCNGSNGGNSGNNYCGTGKTWDQDGR